MTRRHGPQINLAGEPLRNRRFFVTIIAALAVVFFVLALVAGLALGRSKAEKRSAEVELAPIAVEIRAAEKEAKEWDAEIQDLSRKLREPIDSVNGIIRKKGFSCVEIFSRLEDALPPGSSIVLMNPVQAGDTRTELRFRVASTTLQDLLGLIQKLYALGFKDVSVKNESPSDGILLSEITAVHERTP